MPTTFDLFSYFSMLVFGGSDESGPSNAVFNLDLGNKLKYKISVKIFLSFQIVFEHYA